MTPQEDFSFSLEEFSGTARLFPLPNLVLFPHVVQPLHIFEPRYCELLEAAMADDGLIAMATLSPGWEHDYEGRPPVFPMACLGRVSLHRRLPEGGYNLLLLGLCRVRVLRELPPAALYREAVVEVCQDKYSAAEEAAVADLHRQLRGAFFEVLPHLPQAHEQFAQLLGSDLSLGVLTDIISYMLEIDLRAKEALLAETSVPKRARRLLKHLRAVAVDGEPARPGIAAFPPGFSVN
jgi:Lon protease-like protein